LSDARHDLFQIVAGAFYKRRARDSRAGRCMLQ